MPIQMCVPCTATFVPLAANAPSAGNAAGRRSAGTRVQCVPPSVCREDHELAVHGVTERDTVRRIGERHRIEEDLRVVTGELQRPRAAAVFGPVDARRVPGTDAEHGRDARVDGIDVAEVERLGAWYRTRLPGGATIGGPQHRPAAAADPRDLRRHDAHAPEPHRHTARERLPGHPAPGRVRLPRWRREWRTRRAQSSWRGLYRRGWNAGLGQPGATFSR